MRERVQGCVTVGVAMAGAGALALAPMAPQPAVQMRAAEVSKVNLLAETLPTTLQAKLAELATGLAGSGQNFVVDTALGALIPLAVAQALNSADPEAALKAIAGNVIDAPLQIADPTIFALDNILPEPSGGDTSDDPARSQGSDVLKFRVQVLYALREEIKQALGLPSALDTTSNTYQADAVLDAALVTNPTLPDPTDNPVGDPIFTATRLAQGLGFSGERLVESSLKGVLAPVTAAQAIANGVPANVVLQGVIDNFIDAPAYIADPTVFAIDDVLPKALGGGDPSVDPRNMGGSAVSQFRANVILKTRDAIKAPIDAALKSTSSGKSVRKESIVVGQNASATTTSVGKHRATTNNPVSSALKKLAKDVKKATTPKAEKPKANAD
jgi:hypothetical protein